MPKIIENAREMLLEQARVLLIEKSYSELNVRELAKSCGIGIGTFYNYFANKEALIGEIFRKDWMTISRMIEHIGCQDISFKEKCRAIYEALDQFMTQYASVFYELSMTGSGPHQRGCQEPDKYDRLYGQLAEMIACSKAMGQIQTPLTDEQLSQMLISNFIYTSKHRYIDFDTLYSGFNL